MINPDSLNPPALIHTSDELARFSEGLKDKPFIVIDTEFMRERTYWPNLCLIQIAAHGMEGIVDPLAPGLDISPLMDLMARPDMVKVFHSARQDLDIFYNLTRQVPKNIADTQIMAMALGYGDAVSYENLIKDILNIAVDKGARFTDWSQRPLTPRQMKYAISDVVYLLPAYEKLSAELQRRGRLHWIEDEMNNLVNPALYDPHPEEAWRRFKLRSDKPRFLAVLKELAAWREIEARERNVPRQKILKDDALLEIAAHPPQDRQAMNVSRALPKGFGNSVWADKFYAAIERGLSLPKDQIPRLPGKPAGMEKPGPSADLLRVFIKHICEAEQVSPKLLASSSDLDMLSIMGEKADIALLQGWRYELCGKAALDLLQGRIGMALLSKDIQLISLENSSH